MALSSSKKRVKELLKNSNASFRVDNNFPDFRKDPVFIAKHEKAEKLIAEFGLPKSIKQKTKSKTKNQKKV